jgi:hypothetical protein
MNKRNESVERLDFLANVFMHRDWIYTRKTNLKKIQYTEEHDMYNRMSYRIKTAFGWLFSPPRFLTQFDETRKRRLISRFQMFIYSLKRDTNLPDGALDGGNVITFWEETGHYLELVQPSVGSLLVQFLKDEPDHPHAKIIIDELERISTLEERKENDTNN